MQSLIVTTLYLLTSFIPLTFTTINYELFEFPKFILLLAGSLVILVAWGYHWFTTSDHTLLPSSHRPLTFTLLAFLAVQVLASSTSIDPYTSFWGFYSRFHQGLLTTLCYTLIYLAASKWLDNKSTQKLIKISVITSVIVSLYAVAEHFGIDRNLWVQDVQNRVFSTLGQPNWLAAYLLPNMFLLLYLSFSPPSANRYLKSIPFTLLFVALLFTKSRSGLLGFSLAYLTYFALLARQVSFATIRPLFLLYSGIILVTASLIGTPFSPSLSSLVAPRPSTITAAPSGTQLETGGTESGDIRKIVWTGALRLIQRYPLLGTGPETFAYTYYWERPLAHNQTSEWDFLYNKAHNEYLNLAATSGLLGLFTYLAFHYAFLATSWTRLPTTKKINHTLDDLRRYYYPVLGATIIGFTVTNFFGFSVIPVYFLTILLAALPNSLGHTTSSSPALHPSVVLVYFAIPVSLLYPARLFYADYSYLRGKTYFDAGRPTEAVTPLTRATKLRPSEALFHSTLGETYSLIALAAAGSSQPQPALVTKYQQLALREADTTRSLNPHHLNYYKSRAKIYLNLAVIEPSLHTQAATELETAIKLAPTDPKLYYNLGLVYSRLSQPGSAEQQLRTAIALKPNYADPYYALTLLYEQSHQTDKLPSLLSDARLHLATYSSQLAAKISQYAP